MAPPTRSTRSSAQGSSGSGSGRPDPGMIQPWDVYGFRIWKNFTKYLSDFVLLNDLEVDLSNRNNIIKMQSLIYNQFCAPRYVNLFKYAWFKSGYVSERPDKFPNPVAFCFRSKGASCRCGDIKLLTCSWCKADLCFDEYFTQNHLCYNFVE
ncbi:hypothetical protein FOCC_FOCC014680 [Frankliniella occidentalis]|nr:hypothetical protein FOCC_FOCC014680 [Frankliniella occidentalis]